MSLCEVGSSKEAIDFLRTHLLSLKPFYWPRQHDPSDIQLTAAQVALAVGIVGHGTQGAVLASSPLLTLFHLPLH
jgi:hypothetical protein